MTYDSRPDTEAHIARVDELLWEVMANIKTRGDVHDQSKLESPEKPSFDAAASLREVEYGSPEYDAAKRELGLALVHHYKHNSHHPEHYDPTFDVSDGPREFDVSDGVAVSRMSLLDIIEMLVDWKAATERMKDGDIVKSITINQERFGMTDQLTSILRNTAREMGWTD